MASNSSDWERELFESDGELSAVSAVGRDVIMGGSGDARASGDAPALNNSLWKVLLKILSFKLIGFMT